MSQRGGLTPRPYQVEALTAVRDAWRRGNRSPAVVLPTGSGKTVVFAQLSIDDEVRARGRMLAVAHRRELVHQAADKIRSTVPAGVRVGVVMGRDDQVGADIVVASVPTLRSPERRERIRNVGTVVIDECHHATARSYVDLLEWHGVLGTPASLASRREGRAAYAVGFTATMSRGDDAALGDVFPEVVYKRPISYMIRHGFLVQPRGIVVDVEDLDLDAVKRKGGAGTDYRDGDLGRALSESMAPARIIEAWNEHADNKPTIMFTPTVAFAHVMADAFAAEGVKSGVVWGAMPDDQRDETMRAFKAREITVLVNCMVLTEGTDLPLAEVAIIGRPTKHHGLYVQMVGRVLRPSPGKTSALVLDITGASKRHSLAQEIDLLGQAKIARDLTEELEDEQVTLADELQHPETGDDGIEVVYKDGQLTVEHVDLLRESESAWNQTYRGVWFLEAGDRETGRYLVIVASPNGAYHALEVTKRPGALTTRGTRGSAYIAVDVPDLGYCMAMAENDITWREQAFASKRSGWRKRPMSQAQVRMLNEFRIVAGRDWRSNEASAAISRHFASDRIDRA